MKFIGERIGFSFKSHEGDEIHVESSLLSYNKKTWIMSLVEKDCPLSLCIQETKMQSFSQFMINGFAFNDALGSSSGILMIWNSTIFKKEQKFVDQNFVGVIGTKEWAVFLTVMMQILLTISYRVWAYMVSLLEEDVSLVSVLCRSYSDHYPHPFKVGMDDFGGMEDFGLKPFKVFNKWIREPGLLENGKRPSSRRPPLSVPFPPSFRGYPNIYMEACNEGFLRATLANSEASGLKVNIAKSRLFGVGVPNLDVEAIAFSLGCSHDTTPFVYLGLPVGKRMYSSDGWNEVGNRLRLWLSAWKAKSLSIRGGLGTGSLYGKNLALLDKWKWRYRTKNEVLWLKVICSFYGDDGGFGCAPSLITPKGVWTDILKGTKQTDVILPGGDEVCLKDAYPRLFALDFNQDFKVNERCYFTDAVWDVKWDWRLPPRGRAVDELNLLLNRLCNLELSLASHDK
nr:RNA-directed DNA polymerase, eukaryota, reverse transcriptase zinc-binding domain protein [Tanacetum cinerariifolium]GEZ01163.1 RNA-directed DNA polymerase, eukaryota, reverse transcriptase zinc-binding domain protein [Tanacetum cinerariifolium]